MTIRNIFCIFFLIITVNSLHSMDKAETLLEQGLRTPDSSDKIAYIKKAIEIAPNYVEAHYQLGRIYHEIKEYDLAEQSLNQALMVSPDNLDNSRKIQIIFELGKVYTKLAKYNYAKDSFTYIKDLANIPEIKSQILFELGNVYILTEEFDKAIEAFTEGSKLDTNNIGAIKNAIDKANHFLELRTLYLEADSFTQTGEYEKSVRAYKAIMNIDPNYKDVKEKLRQAEWSVANKDLIVNAANIINEAKKVVLSDSLPDLNFSASDIKDEVKQQPRPVNSKIRDIRPPDKTIEKNVENDNIQVKQNQNNEIDIFYQRGLTAYNNQDWQEAIKYFKRIKRLSPDYKDTESLLTEANIALESTHELSEVVNYYNLGIQHFEKKEWLNAIINFEKANVLYPGYKDVESKIEIAQNQLMNKEDTSQIIYKQSDPPEENKNKLLFAGLILSSIFLPLTLVFFLSPELRARYYLLQGNYKRAAQLYEAIINKHPEKTKIYISLANIYINDNRSDGRALEVYLGALKQKLDISFKRKLLSVLNQHNLQIPQENKSTIQKLSDDLKNDIENLG